MRWNLFKHMTGSHGKKGHLLHSIDTANNRDIIGWCFDFNQPEKPVRLRFFLDNRAIGGTDATRFREDLRSYNLHPTGFCGFEFSIPQDADVRNHHFLNIFADPAPKPIQRIPTLQLPSIMEAPLPKLFFMHIPKTAGTSFNAFCRLHFPKDKAVIHIESLPYSGDSDLEKNKNFISGHLTLKQMQERFDTSGFDLLSLVREPSKHLHSHLRWVRNIASDPKSGFFLKHHPAVQETALKLQKTDFSDPRQLQALAENPTGIEIDFFDNLQTRYFLDYRPERVASRDLDQAVKNLSRFRIIGMTERYDRFIDAVCSTYRIEKTLPPVFNKASGNRLFFPEDTKIRAALNPLMQYDLLLYDWIDQSLDFKEVPL